MIYEGQWKDDKQNGRVVEIWPNGERYEGEFDNGFKSGRGILRFNDGSYY